MYSLVVNKMCPLHNLIHLLDSFRHFTNITHTKVEEYNSCNRRFNDYLTMLAGVKDDHLDVCRNENGTSECNCHEYLYNTPVELINEILATIALSYIINFEYYKGDQSTDFEDMSCTNCKWYEESESL